MFCLFVTVCYRIEDDRLLWGELGWGRQGIKRGVGGWDRRVF